MSLRNCRQFEKNRCVWSRLGCLILCAAGTLAAQVETVLVQSGGAATRTVQVTGELAPYQAVDLHARVSGYVEQVHVDRGSVVKRGQALVELRAPEVTAQVAEAESKVQVIDAQRSEAEAKLASAQATYERMAAAAKTPGAVAGNEVVVAQKSVEAAKALVNSLERSKRSAEASAEAIRELRAYLKITAPFDGIVTERNVHPGALASASSGPLLRIEQVNRLRLVVAVPEAEAGSIVRGGRVTFTVPAYAGETFSGVVARIPRSLDSKTRTMPVEADVVNSNRRLAPGMYAQVSWPVRTRGTLLVPPTAVVTTTEQTFVVRVTQGRAEWVTVRRGHPIGDLLEVSGDLRVGDVVVRRATDEIRDGSRVDVKPPPASR
jgi:RND family efflux transporter MFP subunit